MAGGDVRFASVSSAELVPGQTFLLGGREHLGSSLCLMDSYTLISWHQTALAAFDSQKQKQETSQACAFSRMLKDPGAAQCREGVATCVLQVCSRWLETWGMEIPVWI